MGVFYHAAHHSWILFYVLIVADSPSVGGPGPEWSSRTRIRSPPTGTEPAHPLVPPGYRSVWRTLKTSRRVLRLCVSSTRSAFPSDVEKSVKVCFSLLKTINCFISSLWDADTNVLRLNMCCRLIDLLEEKSEGRLLWWDVFWL